MGWFRTSGRLLSRLLLEQGQLCQSQHLGWNRWKFSAALQIDLAECALQWETTEKTTERAFGYRIGFFPFPIEVASKHFSNCYFIHWLDLEVTFSISSINAVFCSLKLSICTLQERIHKFLVPASQSDLAAQAKSYKQHKTVRTLLICLLIRHFPQYFPY